MMPDKTCRVKAFTIMEMTITMLIAAIVIGITYTSYAIISKTYLAFKAKNEDMAVLARLDQLLKRDFDQADLITGTGNQLLIRKANRGAVNYDFERTYIVRNAIATDTFKVGSTGYQTLFEGMVKSGGEGEPGGSTKPEDERIDELFFTVGFQNESIPYHYIKRYSSANLIKRNTNAIN